MKIGLLALTCVVGFLRGSALAIGEAPQTRTVTVELRTQDAVLEGFGPARTVEHTAEFSGTLYVWTSGSDLDCYLRVERANGGERKDDDDSGGGTAPFVHRAVEPGMELVVTVAASKPGTSGATTLHLVAAPETDATRAAVRQTTRALEDVGRLRAEGKLHEARALLDIALRDLLGVAGADSSALVDRAAYTVGQAARELEDWRTTRAAWTHCLKFSSRVLPPDHRDLQQVRSNLALAAWMLDDMHAARALQEQVFEVWSRVLPNDHPDLQSIRHDLGVARNVLGDLHGARQLQERALEVYERTLPDEHPHVQTERGGLAATLRDLGDLHGARELQERVLQTLTRTLHEDDIELQSARQNLATSMLELGDVHGARELYDQVLAAFLRTLPADHIDVQRTRGNLAKSLYLLGDLRGARDQFEEMSEALERTVHQDHPDLLRAQDNLATMLRALGEPQAARPLQERVLEVYTRTLPDAHPALHTARMNLASTLFALGELQRARELQDAALAGCARTLPEGHPDLLVVQEMGLEILVQLKAEQDAVALAHTLVDGLRSSVAHSFAKLSPREVEERVEAGRGQLSLLLSLARGWGVFGSNASLDRAVFARVESARSIGLVSAAIEAQVGKDDELIRLNQAEQRQSSELARLSQTRASPDEIEAARRELDGIRRSRVARLSVKPATEAMLVEPTADTLAAKLAPHEAIVSYWSYEQREVDLEAPESVRRRDALLAYVLRSDGSLARVELGTVERMEDAVAQWRASLQLDDGAAADARGTAAARGATGDASTQRAGEALRELLLDPLRPALGEARHWIVALDDALHAVALDALPMDGALLGERFTIELHLSLRELLWQARPGSKSETMIALGGASFHERPQRWSAASTSAEQRAPHALDESEPEEVADVAAPGELLAQLRGTEWEHGFTALPHTGAEARAAAALHEQAFGESARSIVLEDSFASRESVEQLASSARYVHLATHGWFSPAPEDQVQGGATTRSGSSLTPMLSCGLAFAGANRARSSPNEVAAILTAEELASFDLSSCELAVLSACDTNVGVRRAGQGVASLQKALHMAGARTVVTSLWKVPDAGTKELMLEFYRRLWVEREVPARALWNAKMMLRDAKDAGGTPRYSTRDWAAWVLTGNPD